ncbi:M48 family metallopeptidase [Natrinema salaciae]|uniref:Heat shock protein HtpX n=1 Tax=Natrinema salaciae TaxID=1186196 RepID=A0A1H9CFX0_9EURY|nr:M48 family metalloprotease [Natrinema salaciae]SEP99643.1 heat shock protein HtpX [Natrinema salaciae]
MLLDLRTRVSLVLRMLAALAVLTPVSIGIGATGVLAGGFLGWLALLVILYVLETLLLPVPGDSYGLLEWALTNPVPVVVGAGCLLLPVLYVRPVRDEIRAFRTELGKAGAPASETHPEIATMARRLAQQAAIPEPDVYVADRRRPESYAVGGRSNGTVIVTTGLVNRLSDAELAAVIAHELSHLVNGDSRIMSLVLAPMLLAEHVGSDGPPPRRLLLHQPLAYLATFALWALLAATTAIQRLCCQLAIAVLSRGREFAADRGAAELTGSPSALASALETLDDGRDRPSEDKRTWARSASALDLLPRERAVGSRGWFRTHPHTDERIDRLERLVATQVADAR